MYHERDAEKKGDWFLRVWVDLCAPFDVDELVAETQHVGFLYDVAVPHLNVLFIADCLEVGEGSRALRKGAQDLRDVDPHWVEVGVVELEHEGRGAVL